MGYKSKKTVWLPKSQWIVVENTHEPIIDRDTFETVQRMLAARTRSGVQGTIHPLAKKVVCGCCGSYMEQTAHQPRADGVQRRYVRCRMHQRAPERCSNKTCTDLNALENIVRERIREYAEVYVDPEKVELPQRDDPVRQRAQAKRSELKRLQCEADRRRRALQQLYLDKVSGLIDAAQFSEMNRAFGEEIKSAENRIRGLEAELEQQPEETGRRSGAKAACAGVGTGFPSDPGACGAFGAAGYCRHKRPADRAAGDHDRMGVLSRKTPCLPVGVFSSAHVG